MGSTYTDAIGQGKCKSCPKGFAISSPNVDDHNELADCQLACDLSQYINETKVCVDCEPGFSCNGQDRSECLAGEFCLNGRKPIYRFRAFNAFSKFNLVYIF